MNLHPFFPVLAEIPDIRNWFSSYEYESPVLDSNDIFRDSVSKESEIGKKELIIEEKKELIIEEKNGQKGENTGGLREIMKSDDGLVGENFCTTAFVKCSSSSGNDKQESQPLDKVLIPSCLPLPLGHFFFLFVKLLKMQFTLCS